MTAPAAAAERVALVVRGVVQGVGFRPFVHGVASRLGLAGFVKNRRDGVHIEIEGPHDLVKSFVEELRRHPPATTRIDELTTAVLAPQGLGGFEIDDSDVARDADALFFAPDVATCDECLTDLFDPANRRFLYAFTTCAFCGPRFTITLDAPYDRARTTMAAFAMCAPCQAEYSDPRDRRFHAQAIACPDCGPRLSMLGRDGRQMAGEPVSVAAALLQGGRIVAVKSIGGYHLACDAGNAAAVATLRRRKQRDEKPFAVMVLDVAAAQRLCEISPEEATLLISAHRPIVLLRRRAMAPVADGIAPGNPRLGVFLPYAPLHYLLLRASGGRPLVMTSGNRSDEPIVFDDAEAIERLGEIADAFLTHDRGIALRCDDSVARVSLGHAVAIRRSRGCAPEPIRLPRGCARRVLAVGGHLKNTFAFGRGRNAFVSHHLGDLGDHRAYRAFREAVGHYEDLFGFSPDVIAHDLHPAYATSQYAQERAGAHVEPLPVQHHHAHMASCMVDNGLDEPVIGVTFDGTGYGSDGTIWGGEFLVGDYRAFRRAAHLRPVPMPGGEAAVREPWRMAVAHLLDAGENPSRLLETDIPATSLRIAEQMVRRRLNAPLTSSAGRLFDAVASIIGLRHRVSFEAQAAMQLEWLADADQSAEVYPFELMETPNIVAVDTRPVIAAIVRERLDGASPARVARRFHMSVAAMIEAVVRRLREATRLDAIVLSGGVFMNALLLHETSRRLRRAEFRVYTHRQVPPNDGGLSLGQVAVAAATFDGSVACV